MAASRVRMFAGPNGLELQQKSAQWVKTDHAACCLIKNCCISAGVR